MKILVIKTLECFICTVIITVLYIQSFKKLIN